VSVLKPPTIADLRWTHALAFDATSGSASLTIDGDSREGPSPVQTLAISLAGCMSVDVAHILSKGRNPFRALRSRLTAERAQQDPHRFVRVTLAFTLEGSVPEDVVARAIALSHDKYCSVWHSMRQDIDFTTTFEVRP
jgi:putative redox protein